MRESLRGRSSAHCVPSTVDTCSAHKSFSVSPCASTPPKTSIASPTAVAVWKARPRGGTAAFTALHSPVAAFTSHTSEDTPKREL